LLIVNTENLEVKAMLNICDPLGEKLSRKAVEHDCEALIIGQLTPEAFEILAGECVSRYNGYGYSVINSLILMEQNKLKLIRNPEGTDECVSEHNEGSCDGNHHDHDDD
jgi:predicted Fe-Mo cluster-binding NifX family protein